MKDIETPGTRQLSQIINELKEGSHAIPDFQREFEWGAGDVNQLIRSIFEDYYIGTLLLWRATKDNLSFLKCEPIYGYKGQPNFKQIVLDGQQRLSALYYALFAPDINFPRRKQRYLFFIDLTKLLEENYEEAFIYYYGRAATAFLNDEQQQFAKKIFPLKILGDNPLAWYKWIERYKGYWSDQGNVNMQDEYSQLEKIFSDIINQYSISFIELDRDIAVEKVCDIFTRLNNTGIKLDIFDLLNALLRPKDINLKERWRESANLLNLGDTDKGKVFILQTMSIVKQEYCAPKFLYFLVPLAKKKIREKDGSFHDIVLIKSKEEFDKLWDLSFEKNIASLKMLSNPKDFGAITPKFIPYPTMLPIFTALNIEKDKEEYSDKKTVEEKIRAWYWASIFTTNYSSGVDTQMAQDLREMRKWFLDDKKIPMVIRKFKSVLYSPDFLKKLSAGSAVYKGIFCLLAKRGALDFFSWQLPEYSELDDHHIVPQSWGKKNCPEFADSIFNRTPISDETNRVVISDHLPNRYIKEMSSKNKGGMDDVYNLFKTHLVSREAVDILLRDPFTKEDFLEFLEIREMAIKEEIGGIIKNIPIDITDIEVDYEENLPDESPVEEYLVDPATLLICESADAKAKAYSCRGNRIKVQIGSTVAPNVAPSFEKHNYFRTREELIKTGIISKSNEHLVFTEDYEFSSPSAAAAIVLGRSADGRSEWKTSEGKTLKEIQSNPGDK